MSNIVYWIWFASRKGLTNRQRQELMARMGDAKTLYEAAERDLLPFGLSEEALASLADHDTREAERILDRCQDENVSILCYQDAAYPERLRNIPDPPYVLYIKGRLPAVDWEAVIAIVGTRHSSPYGDKMSRDLAYGIAKGGGIVVTGLAEGADSSAAQGALLGGGRVIGVLGTAINEVFPRFNGRLFDDVAATGALVSEYPPGTPPNKSYFPARNRIIAALSLGTVVTEAPLRSGSLITAHLAADYGRDVFAVPGNADSANSRGSNALLREGAHVATNAWDVLSLYEAQFPEKILREGRLTVPEETAIPEKTSAPVSRKKAGKAEKTEGERGFFKLRVPIRRRKQEEETPSAALLAEQLSGLNERQLKIVGVMGKPSMHIDDIIDASGLSAAVVLSELTLLQVKGYVAQESGKRFTLKITKRGT